MKSLMLVCLVIAGSNCFAQKTLVFRDKVYEPDIKTVQLYPDRGGEQDYLFSAAAPISQMNLVLEFDDLLGNRSNYYARLIHCNYDWTKSNMMDLDFLFEYNEVPINDYTFSSSTYTSYTHYRYPIPQVKIPGNYLIVVYRDADKTDLILSRRLLVYADMTSILRDNQLSGGGALRSTNQQLNFTIDYGRVQIMNPLETVHVVLRQNLRWDNVKVDLKPSFLRESDRQIEFHFFDQDAFFNGGNEFRFVDFRSLNFPGQNTGRINKNIKPYQLAVQQDFPRTDQAYAQYNDLNGNYLIENQDYGEAKTSSNYVDVTFILHPSKEVTAPVYVAGAFNNWDLNDDNRMKFSASKSVYEATLSLKQGLYNYQYLVDSPTLGANYLEGDHFETENVYEVLVYNRSFQPNADLLIGYFVIPVNPR